MIDQGPCVSTPNYEWLKILVSAVAGLFAGVLASMLTEPLKARIQWRINMLRAEKALALDFIFLHLAITAADFELVPKEKFWAGLSLPAYEHYWTKNREVFYDGFEIHTLYLKCALIMQLKRRVDEKSMTIAEAEPTLLRTIREVMNAPKKPLRQRIVNRWLR
jgi:hypothetical protein